MNGGGVLITVTFHGLEVFRRVYEMRSIRLAAERLYLTEPSVSLAVKGIERELGTLLFHRDGHQLVPTDAGEVTYRVAVSILEQLHDLTIMITDMKLGQRGHVEVAGSLTVGSYWLPKLLAWFTQRYPKISVFQHVFLAEEMFRRLLDGEFSFGVAPLFDDIPHELYVEPLTDESVVVVGRMDFPRNSLTIQEVQEYDFVGEPVSSRGKKNFDRLLALAGIPTRRIVFATGHPEGEKEGVMAGLGLLATFRFAVERELEAGLFKEIQIHNTSMRCPIMLVYRPQKFFSPAEKTLISFLHDTARK